MALFLWFMLVVPGDGGATTANFARDVAPLLQRHCVRCHGANEAHSGLRLDSYDAVMRGGDSGPSIVPGNATDSLLMKKIEHRDKPAMPPKKKLSAAEIEPMRLWIDAGARP